MLLQWLEYPYVLILENPILKISRKLFFKYLENHYTDI